MAVTSRSALLGAALPFLAACGDAGDPTPGFSHEPYVLATTYPLAWAGARLLGDAAVVDCPLPPGADPLHWNPPRETVALLQGARLIVINGAGLETWLGRASIPRSRVVDTTAALGDRVLQTESFVHRHGAGGAHTHEGPDGHTWLDPAMLQGQCSALADGLAAVFEEHAAAILANAAALRSDLAALDAAVAELAPAAAGARLFAVEPVYRYLGRRLGHEVHDLGAVADGDEVALAALRAVVAEGTRPVVLWPVPPAPEIAEKVVATGARIAVFRPLGTRSDADAAAAVDYLTASRQNVEQLRAALQ